MLHYVQQLVDNFVCLLFGAVQIKYSWFINCGHADENSESQPKQQTCSCKPKQ